MSKPPALTEGERAELLKYAAQVQARRRPKPPLKDEAPDATTLTVNEAAKYLGLSRARIYQLIAKGQIEAVRLRGGQMYVPISALNVYQLFR